MNICDNCGEPGVSIERGTTCRACGRGIITQARADRIAELCARGTRGELSNSEHNELQSLLVRERRDHG